jgi:integrase
VSVRRDPRSPFYTYNFQIHGRRFFGSTKKTGRREAEAVERQERERARAIVAQTEQAQTSLCLQDIASRYWTEHAQHLAGAPNTWTLIGILIEYFGKNILLTEITDDDVAKFVAWRRGHKNAASALISPFTVNHTTTTLRKLFTRCKLWGVRFQHEPKWTRHLLKVPVERVRELSDEEADKLDAVMRADYAPFFAFMRESGWRLNECLLKWSEVESKQIVKLGKGGRRISVPITSEIASILQPLRGHHPEFVFTYVCERGEHGRVKGQRYPITYAGVQTLWRRLRKVSGVSNFRIHDFRHDTATKWLRETGNLRLVQKALGHASIKTTERYAHVLDSEIADAMERVSRNHKLRNPQSPKLKIV